MYTNAKYKHVRQLPPERFFKSSFITIPVSHSVYKGKKYKAPGVKVVQGKLKTTGETKVQTFLIPL
jgi:hypothetical protein